MSDVAATLGQRLKAERERKSLSAQKVADELHLDGWVIEALESGDYARLGPAVYAKGHLRRYIGLLGLPAAEMLDAYAAESSVPVAPPPPATLRLRTSATAAGELPWLPLAGTAAAVLAIAGLVWWRPWHPRAAAPASPGPAATNTPAAPNIAADAALPPATEAGEPSTAAAPPVASGWSAPPDGRGPPAAPPGAFGDAGTPVSTGQSVAGASRTAGGTPSAGTAPSAAASLAHKDADPNAGAGRARLRLSFSSESWVDVRDAQGQRLFAGNGHANSVKTIAGAAPLRVYLKSANGVQLEINNHAVAIGSRFVVGNVAHFEAGADGVLRRDPHATGTAGAAAPARPRG